MAARAAGAAGRGCGPSWSAPARLASLPGPLLEVSGFTSSARYPGVAWMITDSDTPSSLYSFELSGNEPRWQEFKIDGVPNVDWEDLTYTVGADGRGRLWILDNGAETGPKKLYEVLEPDPRSDRSATIAATYRVEYPGANVNTEAIFASGGRLAFVSKTSPNRVYALPGSLSRYGVNDLSGAGRLDVASFVTATSTSADERLLMTVGTDDQVTVFENTRPGGGLDGFVGPAPIFRKSVPDVQHEAGDFFPHTSCDIVLVSEDASVWRLSNPGTVVALGVPEVPTGVVATAGDGQVTVSWTAPGDSEAASGYQVTTRQGGAEVSVTTVEGPVTSAVVGGLSNGSEYTFTVAALNASSTSAPSEPSPAVIPRPGGAPAPPAGSPAPVPSTPPPGSGAASRAGEGGYWLLAADGAVHPFGGARSWGRLSGGAGAPAVDLEPTPSNGGYWILDATGRVGSYGDAAHLGDADHGRVGAGERATSLSRLPNGSGYWIFTDRGRALPFGDAPFLGDLAGQALNGPVLDSVPTPSGRGYYMVASDGGVFTFGDAAFAGSMGAVRLNAPVESLVPDPDGSGYWLVAADGGVFAFDAPFRGSLGGVRLNRPVTGMAAYGNGYLMVGEDGGIFNFSDRPFVDSLGGRASGPPIVSVAVLAG